MGKAASWIKENLTPLLVSGVFFVGILYATTTSWQNTQKLSEQAEQLASIRSELIGMKKTLISVLLDKNPNKSEIIKGLVSDSHTRMGIDQFKAGNFEGAFAVWNYAAQRGSEESAFALKEAASALKVQAADESLSVEQRQKARAALAKISPFDTGRQPGPPPQKKP